MCKTPGERKAEHVVVCRVRGVLAVGGGGVVVVVAVGVVVMVVVVVLLLLGWCWCWCWRWGWWSCRRWRRCRWCRGVGGGVGGVGVGRGGRDIGRDDGVEAFGGAVFARTCCGIVRLTVG